MLFIYQYYIRPHFLTLYLLAYSIGYNVYILSLIQTFVHESGHVSKIELQYIFCFSLHNLFQYSHVDMLSPHYHFLVSYLFMWHISSSLVRWHDTVPVPHILFWTAAWCYSYCTFYFQSLLFKCASYYAYGHFWNCGITKLTETYIFICLSISTWLRVCPTTIQSHWT